MICGLVLFISFFISWSKQQSSSSLGTTLIHRGRCKDTGTLNTILHLALNIISTGILSSSNFFMQIVTSPSRPEINLAHTYLRSLDIGLQSVRNLPSLSKFKQACWALLLFSSLPIHLLFNSAIYETRYQGQFWNLTIATEDFVHGGQYWLPGASLTPSGASSPSQDTSVTGPTSNLTGSRTVSGYGRKVNLTDYWNPTSNVGQTIKDISQASGNWDTLDARQCMSEYRAPKLRTEYKSLVIIANAGLQEPKGWKRTDVYTFDPKSNLSRIWNAQVPPLENEDTFYHSCGRILGLGTSYPTITNIPDEVTPISFADDGSKGLTTSREIAMGYRAKLRTFDVRYCLAEPIETCQVRASSSLLLVVLLCVVVKIIICSTLVWRLEQTSLVTPGDAIESFITAPDPITLGISTMSLSDSQSLEYTTRSHYKETQESDLTFIPKPRRWQCTSNRLQSAVSLRTWVQVYYPIFLFLLAFMVCISISGSQMGKIKNFGPSEGSETFGLLGARPDFLGILLFANLPQLIISFCYLTINNLYTQLQAEQEWNSYSAFSQPLRVSYPAGEQVSTYRLQLPYKYSIPLITMSTIIHWLMSNSLFLLIIEGDTGVRDTFGGDKSSIGVSEDASVVLGVSGVAMVITFVISFVFAISPLVFRCRRLRYQMVVGGTNSLVLSAACHVPGPLSQSSVAHVDANSPEADESAMDSQTDAEYLEEISRGKLRWGAMTLPASMAKRLGIEQSEEQVMHLGFASEDHHVRQPKKGELYVLLNIIIPLKKLIHAPNPKLPIHGDLNLPSHEPADPPLLQRALSPHPPLDRGILLIRWRRFILSVRLPLLRQFPLPEQTRSPQPQRRPHRQPHAPHRPAVAPARLGPAQRTQVGGAAVPPVFAAEAGLVGVGDQLVVGALEKDVSARVEVVAFQSTLFFDVLRLQGSPPPLRCAAQAGAAFCAHVGAVDAAEVHAYRTELGPGLGGVVGGFHQLPLELVGVV
ncbi:26S proteasome non-ATPase regulatory subunit 12 [Apiospora arundinis]